MDDWILKRSKTVHDTAGRKVRVLEDPSAIEAAGVFRLQCSGCM